MSNAFEKISPTAFLIAHFRSFSDVPFARAVATATNASDASLRLLGGDPASLLEVTRENAPQSEARYQCITSAIRRQGVRRVLELGAGLSFRGVAMTADPSLRYVATDLPELTELARSLTEDVPELRAAVPGRDVVFESLDVLEPDDFVACTRHFDAGPLAVVNEGLLGYFSREEKAVVAANVRSLLERFGGVWVTPDLPTREQLARAERPATRAAHEAVERSTARKFSDNVFEDLDEMKDFFRDLGFSIETRPQLDGSFTLSSLEPLGLPPDHAKTFEAHLEVRVLRLLGTGH